MAEGGAAKEVTWTVYSCSQNLPAILNDPKRGKQRDFFTRTWGDSFVDTATIHPSARLEDVPNAYFVPYCRKLLKRYKKLQEKKSTTPVTPPQSQDSLNSFFPTLLARDRESNILLKPESSPIPKIFFTQNFTITNPETFREIYDVHTQNLPSKLVQDKLSHYLDMVEVGLAQQISKKSSLFFSAVSTQDKVAEKVSKALICVQQIKEQLTQVRQDHVVSPLNIIKLAQKKSNLIELHQKLQLMATVHQAQRAIQSLLGNSDYVGALDLISTTQEVLRQELQGLVSFRHLDSQLVEIRNAIEKMLRAELERNLSADLNRPIEQIGTFYDKDRLISIFLGHLRLAKVAPIVAVLAKEISTAMTATCKQTLIEAVSESDSKSDSLIGSMAVTLAIPQLSSDLWVKMITQLGERLVFLLQHIQEVILLFQDYGDSAVGRFSNKTDDAILPETEEPLVTMELYANLTSELSAQLEKTTTTADEKFTGILRARKTWNNRAEFYATLQAVRKFISELELFLQSLSRVTSSPKPFRFTAASEMKTQTTEFFRDFHSRQTQIVNQALDREKWRIANPDKVKRLWPVTDITTLIQNVALADSSTNNPLGPRASIDMNANANNGGTEEDKDKSFSKEETPEPIPTIIDSAAPEEIRTAEIFFVILYVMAEYCHLVTMTCNPEVMLGVVDLLRGANVRLAHLVLGAGAVELKVTKSITVANLAVVVRGLSLLSTTLPQIKQAFKESLPSKNHHLLKHVDAVQSEMQRHSEDIETKMVIILSEVIDAELSAWEARPPVPSVAVNNVSKSIVRFREAIGPMLTQKQISNLFLRIDRAFRTKLKERIASLGILKDGGPRHGVVTSEMMHYAENLRKLNVLPANVISNAGLTHELWSSK